ncbi:MAG: exo-alpha-sialidase, partial [Brevinema sp.]
NTGIPIDGGTKSKSFRIPAILSIPGYTFITADMRYGAPADSAHNIDTVIRRSTDNGKTWEGMRMVQYFDDFAPTNISETVVGESASFIDPAIMIAKNGDLLTVTTTFPWNSGLGNIGRHVQPLPSYFKSGNDIYMKLRYGIIPEANGGNTWRGLDNNDSAYEYAVKVSSFNERNPIVKRDLTEATGDQSGYSIDQYYNLYKDGVQLKSDQYLTGRPNNTKVKKTPLFQVDTHLFYTASVFHPVPTSYIFVARSKDKGNTWSKPLDVTWNFDNSPSETPYPTENKNDLSGSSFLGVSPGIGYTVKEGRYQGRLLVALQKSPASDSCEAFSMYSDDNGLTWRSGDSVSRSPSGGRRSESQYIEAPDDQLLLVHRTGNVLAYSTSEDGGVMWKKITEPVDAEGNKIKNVGSDGFGAMVGASNLRRVHYFNQPMFALSLATGNGRRAGKVYVGYLKKDRNTGDWDIDFNINGNTIALPWNPNNESETAAYSSVAELDDGSLGLFYEGAGYGGGGTRGSTISFVRFPVLSE